MGADLLAELRVDGEDLRVTNEGKSENGNGVRRLPGTQTCVIGRADHWLVRCVWYQGMKPGQGGGSSPLPTAYLGVHGEHVCGAVGIILLAVAVAVVVAGQIVAEVGGRAVG